MQARHLLLQGFLTCLVLASANYAAGRLASTTVASQLLEKCRNNSNYTDLFIGNSLIASGIDEITFNETIGNDRKAFNAGCGSTSPLDHSLIVKESNCSKRKLAIYGFFDTQLTDKPNTDWEFLSGNRTFLFKSKLEKGLDLIVNLGPYDRFILRFLAKAPVIYERLAIWAKVEKARAFIRQIGIEKEKKSALGDTDNFILLEPNNSDSFSNYLEKLVKIRENLSPPINEIINDLNSKGNTCFFVLMPMPKEHRKKYNSSANWDSYIKHIIFILNQKKVIFINALDWVEDSLFEDRLHLSKDGSTFFTSKLTRDLLKHDFSTIGK